VPADPREDFNAISSHRQPGGDLTPRYEPPWIPRSWAGAGDVEQATAEWVHWYNTTRVHGSIGLIPPVEYEALYLVNTPFQTGEVA
jgi:transposase InsO family protein